MINTGFNKYFFLLFFILLFSCGTTQENLTSSVPEEPVEEYFQQFITSGDYQNGLSELLLSQQRLDKDLYNHFREEFLQGWIEDFTEEPEDKSWTQTMITYHSLQVMDESLFQDEDKSFLIQLFQRYQDAGFVSAAASLLLDHSLVSVVSDDLLNSMEEYFFKNRLRSSLTMVVQEKETRNMETPSEVMEYLAESESKSDIVKGTVTLWVDKGIRMEGGLGIPDRVIGSGFFIDNQGYLLTNYHVISSEVDPEYEGYSKLYIKRNDREGEKIPARVISWDPQLDLALVKTEMPVEYHFSFAPESTHDLGESIYAIGSPGGLEKTLTSGSISSIARYLQPLGQSMQVDVPINPGNSGGPLLNQQGEVIGVVFAGIEEFEGINFAIPSYYVKALLPRFYQGGKVEYGWLGAALVKDFDKLLVSYVFPGQSGERAGLRQGDQILSINGQKIESITDIQNILIPLPPGTIISLRFLRDEEEHRILLPLALRPDYPMEQAFETDAKSRLILPVFGMEIESMDNDRGRRWYRVNKVYPGTIADEMGIIRNDNFKIQKWILDSENKMVLLQIILEGKSMGYMKSAIQIGSWYAVNHFI